MKFVDYVTITVRSGKGGAGAMSFRRAKYEPKGGPDGGDGGQGGSVLLRGDPQLYTLLDFRYNRHHFAESGQSGSGANKTGRSGEDIVLRVPLGTLARDGDTERVIGEVVEAGQEVTLARGGRGGKGNFFFRTATNQAPRHSQPGEPGEELNVTLELKLMADVGLVGFPNAGKSTLVSTISAARPKIADYPFTTLEPSLGVVGVGEYRSFVVADIPGIVEGAAEGRGLGLQFLKHIERNAVLLFLVPIDEEDPPGCYATLLAELESFNRDLLGKPRLVALSKLDLVPPDEREQRIREVAASFPEGVETVAISSVAHLGLESLKEILWGRILAHRGDE
jgi:GTP-binding protein